MSMQSLTDAEVRDALLDPTRIFTCPVDVLGASGISDALKVEILRRWEYDVREQEVAQEENMSGELRVTLSHVLEALSELGSSPDGAHSPPTKQGGI